MSAVSYYNPKTWDSPLIGINIIKSGRCDAHGARIDCQCYSCHLSMESNEDLMAQYAAETYAENAWLRAAEAGTPESWSDEDREREMEAAGW